MVQYVASFSIVKPADNANISGILWHDVPNRGGRIVIDAISSESKTRCFAVAGSDALDHVLQTSLKGNVVLNVSIENAKLYALEVL